MIPQTPNGWRPQRRWLKQRSRPDAAFVGAGTCFDGRAENPARLVASIIRAILQGNEAKCSSGSHGAVLDGIASNRSAEDVVRFGPQHRRNGRLIYRQAKNEHRNPIDLDIPVHPKLAESLDAYPSEHLTYLVTDWGQPFSFKGFGNRFKDWCRAAGLPDRRTLHGVRKHTASWLAEERATAHQIGSVGAIRKLK